MKSVRMGLCLMFVAAAGWLAGCGPEPVSDAVIVRPVKVYRVGNHAGERKRTFSGTARPAIEAEISFRVPGEIVELPIRPGVKVGKGDLLAKLDDSDYDLQLKQAEAQLSQAAAMLNQARSQYDRARELYESQSASKSELDDARAAFESAEAQHVAAQKSRQLAAAQLGYCVLTAPFSGQIAARPVDIFQTVSAGQAIATLASDDAMQMVLGIPEALINQIDIGNPAVVKFDALKGQQFDAAVIEVGTDAGGKSVYPVKLSIKGDVGSIRAGMIGEASLHFDAHRDSLLVPVGSVVGDADGSRFVWVVDPNDETIARRNVEVGALTSAGLEIRSGLESGEMVVTHGVHKIAEGLRVRIME